MAYKRFNARSLKQPPATDATLATVSRARKRSVAVVASVAGRPLEKEGESVANVASVAAPQSQNQDAGDRYDFEERAAIREFDGGFERKTAEILAWRDIKERRR